jgi:hypothetical protein
MASESISINRAPVLTLWAAVVAERLGFKEDEASSLAKELVEITVQVKGLLGVMKPATTNPTERGPRRNVQIRVRRLDTISRFAKLKSS